MRDVYEGFLPHALDATHAFWTGRLPADLRLASDQFNGLWSSHPDQFHEILMHGRRVATPRWQQAYGADYHYTGTTNRALPVPDLLTPLLAWARRTIEPRLNGLLLNWYDGARQHYIGRHRDSVTHMVYGTPIATVSFGEERVFRLRPWRGTGSRDFLAADGDVFLVPYATNLSWTHEVPAFARYRGRRISVTIRAFDGD